MSLIDTLLFRNAEQTARAEAMREFRRLMPRRGRISRIEESGITAYYDKRFGRFEPSLDRWDGSQTQVLIANPQLRRIDVVADTIFRNGTFRLCKAGHIRSGMPPFAHEGMIAAINLVDSAERMSAILTLDIGDDVRFSKLRVATCVGYDFIVRLSTVEGGMIIGPSSPVRGPLPESVRERAAEVSEMNQTISGIVAAIEGILRRIIPGK